MSANKNDSWIEFDFINRKINVSSYTIRTHSYNINSYHPKSWRIIGSNDHKKWDEIDIINDDSNLNGSNKQHRFICNKSDKFYQYIKYVQTGIHTLNNYFNKGCICLACIEFFGSIESS